MNKPVFVLDVDGVLADFMWGMTQALGKALNPRVYSLSLIHI